MQSSDLLASPAETAAPVPRARRPAAAARPLRAPGRLGLKKIWKPILAIPLDAAAVALGFYSAYCLRFSFGPLLRALPVPGSVVFPWRAFSADLLAIVPIW